MVVTNDVRAVAGVMTWLLRNREVEGAMRQWRELWKMLYSWGMDKEEINGVLQKALKGELA